MDALKVKYTIWEKLWKIVQFLSLIVLAELMIIVFAFMA